MAAPQVSGIRTTAAREAIQSGVEPDLSVPEALNKKYKHVYQSKKSAFVLSLKRRKVHWLPDGSREEETPMSAQGNRLDMIRFVEHFFRTDDDEIAAAIAEKPAEIFGTDGLCWRYEEKVAEHRAARAAEIRAALAADPDLAKEVAALRPSDKKDWTVEPKDAKPAVPRQTKAAAEMSEEELEAATAPPPGSRTR